MKKNIWMAGLLLSGATLPALAAQPMADMPGMQMEEKTGQAHHQGIGRIEVIDRARLSIKLAHEPIKSLGWPGMTMQFKVASAALLNGIKAGDTVRFELGKDVQPGKWLVTGIAPQGTPPSTVH